MPRIAVQVMLGAKLKDMGLVRRSFPHYGVKEAVFPFNMFPEVDPVLGPEMRSTGEVLGLAGSYGMAFYKSQEATGSLLPLAGTLLLTVAEHDRPAAVEAARRFTDLGFSIIATQGTTDYLAKHGVAAQPVLKLHEGRPNVADAIMNGKVQLVVNTPSGKASIHDDSYIRKAAIKHKIPYITTIAAAMAAAEGIAARKQGKESIKSLQEYHAAIG
jgi:carbamoyl-phosphate synthase large subunit